MRLTLRTLLAYLDNTLTPSDAEVLRNKLSESEQATSLVQRIREGLLRMDLNAMDPRAAGPIEDANMASEYLDSTLPAEQVAEIERAALGSDMYLAELAGCHQVLTLVLGRPANVSESLRTHIYSLAQSGDAAAVRTAVVGRADSGEVFPTGNVSAVGIDSPSANMGDDSLDRDDLEQQEDLVDGRGPESAATLPAARMVEPVGRTDSGVADAPTRIPRSATGNPDVRQRDLDGDTASLRLTRIMPWLVSLALVAVLLFALVQVFRPVLGTKVANNPNQPQRSATDSATTPSPSTPPVAVPLPGDEARATNDPQKRDLTNVQPGGEKAVAESAVPTESADDVGVDADSNNVDPSSTNTSGADPSVSNPSATAPAAGLDASITQPFDATRPPEGEIEPGASGGPIPLFDQAMAGVETDGVLEPAVPGEGQIDPNSSRNETGEEIAMNGSAAEGPDADSSASIDPPTVVPDSVVSGSANSDSAAAEVSETTEADADGGVAVLRDEPTLVIRHQTETTWQRIGGGDSIPSDVPITVGPTFRAVFVMGEDFELQVIGPAEFQVRRNDQMPEVSLNFGRILLRSEIVDAELRLLAGPRSMDLKFPATQQILGAEVAFQRRPGDDLSNDDRLQRVSLFSVVGDIDYVAAGSEAGDAPVAWKTMVAGSGIGMTSQDSEISEIAPGTLPNWTRWTLPTTNGSLDAAAREGLLSLIDPERRLSISLREATTFRRDEVAALAAETLLTMGRAEVYFGVDGLLNQPKQRLYWPAHFEHLLMAVNRGPESAEGILRDIASMDSAGRPTIQRLLTGFSNADLENGGDETLVQGLNSTSMAIRVLSFMNLKMMTGQTMFYRPEYETDAKRDSSVKKWLALLRKGEIRWRPESEIGDDDLLPETILRP